MEKEKELAAHQAVSFIKSGMVVGLGTGSTASYMIRSLAKKVEEAAFTAAISHFGASQLKKLSSPDVWKQIKIVRCGVEKAFYENASAPPPASPNLVCVGRLCAEKGQIDLVDAAARVARERPELRLTLIGDGPMRADIEAAIDR